MNPRRIEIPCDTGWASLGCAVPLVLLGAAVLVFPPAGGGGAWFLGLLFVGLGVWGALWRERLILDAQAGTVTSWQGLLRPMRVRTWPIGAFDRVAIHCWRNGIPSKLDDVSSLTPNFPIQLEGPKDTVRLVFEIDYAKGRTRAGKIARLFSLPLLDDCRQTVVILQPDGTEVAAAAPATATAAPPALPAGSRIQTYEDLDRFVFDLPTRLLDRSVVLRILLGAFVPLIFLVLAFLAPHLPAKDAEEALFGERLCWVLFWVTLPTGALPPVWALTRRERITVTPRRYKVEWRAEISAGSREVGLSKVLDLLLQSATSDTLRYYRRPGLALAARMKDGAIECGTGLGREELEWLRFEVECAIAAARRAQPQAAADLDDEEAEAAPAADAGPAPDEEQPGSPEAPGQGSTPPAQSPRRPWRPVMPPWRK